MNKGALIVLISVLLWREREEDTHVGALEVEVRELERDAEPRGRHDLPDALLVGRVEVGEGRARDHAAILL